MRPVIGITADNDGYIIKLKRDYLSAVENAGGMPLVLVPVSDGIPRIAAFVDGVIISGGGDLLPQYWNEEITVQAEMKFTEKNRTDFEFALVHEINKKKKPILGICYGMQLINSIFGGTLYQDIGLQKKGSLDHKTGSHAIKTAGPFIESLGLGAINASSAAFEVNSHHHQAVKKTGGKLATFAQTEDGIIEGIYHPDYPFLAGVQWHPERSYDKLSLNILRSFIEKSRG